MGVLHQLCYISSVAPGAEIDIDALLCASRRNNARTGITGLLVYDGRRFLQAIEGPHDGVESLFERIAADARHRGVVVLNRRLTEERVFGDWAMAWTRRGAVDEGGDTAETIDSLTSGLADPNMRATFRGFARLNRAA